MTEHEKLMYTILGQLSKIDIPIVFKGGLITSLILEEQGFTDIQRATKDIDANWISTPPSMSALVDTINNALGELREYYIAESSREYGDGKSAGISIREKDSGDKIITMDIDIKPLIGSKIYYLGETSIKGVLPSEILADKICAISTDAVFKHRAKDIIDIYSLSHCTKVSTKEIYEICDKANRKIKSFDAFFSRKADIEHAYNKLRGIGGKPPFSDVYAYLSVFVEPFVSKDTSDRLWDVSSSSWEKQSCSFLSRNMIKDNAKKISEKSAASQPPQHKKKEHDL
ncbi:MULTISPECIES: nucleotidyl transferase AbiEii/AbiGii toxin family protein [unclassified Ruminococcus]|uniref:nucleotidyl transferase AbiEii/AbiGii toxin family protein n=1 Tax=unclassified Ruminococcus TaxID=2608920 RepID=UPI00210D3074|nr:MULTISPECIES: nucleotidyl transferase AbiEii/AbiGii toxin family protein [unclassified Ruminococcus]MCQ4021727.1 hypothetical protein [Ruminococcus sp. zg-924]MCQ4114171.1 hypothetical protein [Ruminococcus sp. zg-921]